MSATFLYIDLDDLADAISFYARDGALKYGQAAGFAHSVREFVPTWSLETCRRFVRDVTLEAGQRVYPDGLHV